MQLLYKQLSLYKQRWQCCLLCLCCLLLLSNDRQQPAGPGLRATLEKQLKQYRDEDNLTEWIYSQLEWVNKNPVGRAVFLRQATTTAWRGPRSDEEIQAWQALLVNQGYALLISGDIVHSTDAYRAAIQWARQHRALADDSVVLENILKPLGNNYTRLGDYEQALFIQHMALQTAQALNDKNAVAGTSCNLAATASSMGQAAQSLQYCREGLKAVAGHTALYGLLLSEQAEAWLGLQQPDSARRSIQQSIQVLEKKSSGDPYAAYWLLNAYQQAGDIETEKPLLAQPFYNKALALQTILLQQNGDIHKRERAKLFYRMGKLYAQLQQYDAAGRWLQECLQLLLPGRDFAHVAESDLYGENTLLDVLYTRATLSAAQRQTDEALRLYHLCFATEKKLRNEFISGASKERSIADSRRRYETAIDAAWNAWQQTQRPVYRQQLLQFIESSKAQLLLEEVLQQQQYRVKQTPGDTITGRILLLERALAYYQKNRLEKEQPDSLQAATAKEQQEIEWELAGLLKKTQHGVATNTAPGDTAFSPAALSPLLENNQVILSFFMGLQSIYTVEMDKTGITFAGKQPAGQTNEQVYQFTQQYFQQGAKAMLNQPKQYYQQAYSIYHQLFGRHPLRADKAYIILPDGAASSLPVDALVTQPGYTPSVESWPFVVKQTLVSYAYSLQTLKEQLLSRSAGKGFTGFFIEQNTRQQPDLAAVVQERQGIARTVQSGQWLINEQATADAFRDALDHAAVVHISTHAFAKKDSIDAPHIELYNEPFYLFELKSMQQHPAMVVLSACRTGDGRLVTGEGVQSLARAFIAGSTNAVVAGWWNVNDEATAQLMQQFYASLSGSNHAAGALRQAKLGWLNNKDVSYLHKLPYYWAALNYYGHPSPLPDNSWMKKSGPRVAWFLLLILPVIGLLVFFRHRIIKYAAPQL